MNNLINGFHLNYVNAQKKIGNVILVTQEKVAELVYPNLEQKQLPSLLKTVINIIMLLKDTEKLLEILVEEVLIMML